MEERYTRYPRPILWLVRGGEVRIGGDETDARPRFTARVEAFYLSKAPVTNEQYSAYDPAWQPSPLSPAARDAAIGVSFRDAVNYCAWYAHVSRKPMRLPAEVEWEYACRAGAATSRFWGDEAEGGEPYLWDSRNSGGRSGSWEAKLPNPFGLHGMLGGVWEWTSSLYRPYPIEPGDGRDDLDLPGPRVLRGGSFRVDRERITASVRLAADPEARPDDASFRIARSFG